MKSGSGELVPAPGITREVGKYLVTLTVDGLIIREKERRLQAGLLSYDFLFHDSLQRQAGLSSIGARSASAPGYPQAVEHRRRKETPGGHYAPARDMTLRMGARIVAGKKQ